MPLLQPTALSGVSHRKKLMFTKQPEVLELQVFALLQLLTPQEGSAAEH